MCVCVCVCVCGRASEVESVLVFVCVTLKCCYPTMQVLSPSPLLPKNALTNLVALLLLFRFLFLTSTEDESWKKNVLDFDVSGETRW